jgi:hypothetical protein
MSIYEAVGLEESKPTDKDSMDKSSKDDDNDDGVDSDSCGPGTVFKDGACVLDEPKRRGGCLIATATYGSELAPQVQLLREVRDDTLLGTTSGTTFMTGFNQLYYSFSPTIADWERENSMFRDGVRAFITPMIYSLSIMTLVDEGSDSQVLGFGLSVIALNLGMYIAAPAILVWKINKRYH